MKNFKNHIMEHLSSYKENVLNIKNMKQNGKKYINHI